MDDFILVSASWMLNQQVTTYGEDGSVVSDDGGYQRRGAEQVYVFAEFMRNKGLLEKGVKVSRNSDFELRFSQLTGPGQKFARAELAKWMQAMDRAGPKKQVDATGLERRWTKYADR